MPSAPGYKRDYKQELKTAKKRGENKDMLKRNKARRMLEKEGVVKKYDGKDVDHKKPIRSGGGNGRANLRAVARSINRSVKRK